MSANAPRFLKSSVGGTVLVGAAVVGVGISLLFRDSSGKQTGKHGDDYRDNLPADPNVFRKARLVSFQNVGADAKLLRFRFDRGVGLSDFKPVSHVSLSGVSTDVPPEYPFGLRVERSYSPVFVNKTDFEVLVKGYPREALEGKRGGGAGGEDAATSLAGKLPKGITSRFLLNLKKGEQVDVKGPFATIPTQAQRDNLATCRYVGMLCGGSGVTPMLQILSRVGPADASRRFFMLWSNRSLDHMFYRSELEHKTKSLKNVFVKYTLTRVVPSGWAHDTGRVSKDLIRARMPPPGPETVIVVSGPDAFVQTMAGGYRNREGNWTGELGGYLKELGYSADSVVRL